jgi:signal peptidase I
MEPNFHDREYLIIDEISYRFNPPIRGQVSVFRYPRNPQEYFIKRVIGLPGESVQIKDGEVIIYNETHPEGFVLQEDYLSGEDITYSQDEDKVDIGADEYYVLGDNRGASKDSRYFGLVNKSFVIGKVLLRGWPFNKAQVFSNSYWPEY